MSEHTCNHCNHCHTHGNETEEKLNKKDIVLYIISIIKFGVTC